MSRSQKLGVVLSPFLALFLCLSGCGYKSDTASVNAQAAKARPSPRSTPLARSESSDSDESSDESEPNDNEDSDTETKDFHGYPCTVDCSGHEAGYKWAEEHDIHDPDDCGGNSQSFIEGCRAWAEENP